MKKITLVLLALVLATTLPANAQFGKLLAKVKGKPKAETASTDAKPEDDSKVKTGKGSSKKSGNFATVWETEFDNKASRKALCSSDGQFIIGTDDNSASVVDANGKALWSGDYKKLTTNKTNNSEYQYTIWNEKGGYLFLFDKRSLGTDRVAVLDLASGKELWNSELYQNLIPKGGTKTEEGSDQGELETVKYIYELDSFLISQKNSIILVNANSGEKIWETNRFKGGVGKYVYDAKRNEIIMVNFKPTALGALFTGFKNQLVRINAVNGDIVWDATFRGTIEKELVTRRAIIDLWIKGDKIFMFLDGMNVYDYNTGQKLWEATYENDMAGTNGGVFNGKVRQKIYGTLADPLFTEDAVYIVMLGTRDRTKYVEKHDLASGKLLWASEKITGAFCMPHIYRTGDKIMVQVGGKVQVQEFRFEEVSAGLGLSAGMALAGLGGGGTVKRWVPYIYGTYKNQKNSVIALDDKNGTTAWRSEKFDKRITDFIIDQDKTLFVGDGDEFYGYDIASGNQLFDVKHNDAKVGKATDVIDFNDKVIVISEKGLAAYIKKDGQRAYATEKLKGIDQWYNLNGNFFLRDQRNSKNIIYGIDMTTGETKGMVQSKGVGGSPLFGDGIDITADGEYIFAFKGKKVEKIKVNN